MKTRSPHWRAAMIASLNVGLISASSAEILLSENFDTDPIGTRAIVTGDGARFQYSAGELLTDFNIAEPHARVAWPLSRTLTETDTFALAIEFELDRVDFDPFSNFCQLSFGFINQANTGPVRTSSPADSWELLTIDYFPGAYPSYTPTFIRQRPSGGGNLLTDTYLKFPDGPASLIADFDEIEVLPERTSLTTTLHYDGETQMITISLADDRGGLLINNELANPDGIESTIQLQLDSAYPFEFDAFALLNWHHSQGGVAEFTTHSILVESPNNEPIDLLAAAFPDGFPSPVYQNDQLSLTYVRDVTKTGFEVAAEASTGLDSWTPISHSVISAGPGVEVRRVSVPAMPQAFLRLRVTQQ